jgi:hypothetical protein
MLLSDVSFAIASTAGLLTMGVLNGSSTLCDCTIIVLAYMRREGFLEEWKRVQRKEAVTTAAICTIAFFLRIVANVLSARPADAAGLIHMAASTISTTMLGGLVYCVFYVCNALNGMLNLFSEGVASHEQITQQIHEWNVMQAILRTGSGATQACIFVLILSATCFLLLFAVDVIESAHPLHLCAGFLNTLNIARAVFCAASITEKCDRIPSLVNSLNFGKEMDESRQYLVNFILQSKAGFHIFEVRLTSAMVLKYLYLCIVVVIFCFAKV